jgi:hypothetical protein
MTAISRNKVKIAIMAAATAPSDVAASDWITGEIKEYSQSGGEKDVESDPHFGGFVDKEKPVSQVEISFEITPSLADGDRWEQIARSADVANPTVYTLAGDVSDKSVFIQAGNATDGWASVAFNNANVTTLDMSHSADDNRTNTLNLKLSPTNASGVSNYMSSATDVASLPNWTALDNN